MNVLLTTGPLPVVLWTLSAVLLLVTVATRSPRRWRRTVLIAVPAAAALAAAAWLTTTWTAVLPFAYPTHYVVLVGLVFFPACLLAVDWRSLGRRRLVAAAAVPVLALSTAVTINRDYGYFPDLRSVFTPVTSVGTDLAAVQRDRHAVHGPSTSSTPTRHTVGVLVEATIPAAVSHFSARPALLWLPPAYRDGRQSAPPVVMLLAGSPGQTSDWERGGNASKTAQAYADRHGGVAPIVVMPDANGSVFADTECVDGAAGNAETYLAVDVPAFLHAQFGTDLTRRSMAVAGLSEGGTCSAMLALRHPDLFAAFANFSGLASPTVAGAADASSVARSLFGGSRTAYDTHNPSQLLGSARFPEMTAFLASGGADQAGVQALTTLADRSRRAVRTTCVWIAADATHSFTFWSTALASTFAFVADMLLGSRTAPDPGPYTCVSARSP